MMHIHHIALWSKDIDQLAAFYADMFGAAKGNRFQDQRSFASYMVRFETGCVLEMMQMPGTLDRIAPDHDEIHHVGLHHFAFAVSSEDRVRELFNKALTMECRQIKPPHATEDGYFEAMFTDPDGNLVEICYEMA